MNFFAVFVDAVKTTDGARVDASDVVAVIGKVFAGRETGSFTDDFVPLDNQMGAIGVVDHPLAAEQRDGAIGGVLDGDKVHECVGLILGQAHPAMMINEFIKTGGEARQCEGSGHGRIAVHERTNARKGALQTDVERAMGEVSEAKV